VALASPAEGLWTGTYFLISYWIVFTAAVFLSKHEKLAGQKPGRVHHAEQRCVLHRFCADDAASADRGLLEVSA